MRARTTRAQVFLAALVLAGCANQASKRIVAHSEPTTKTAPTDSVPTPDAPLAQQKMCADQAQKSFDESTFATDKSSLGNTFTNHYDPAARVCYVEVTTRHMLVVGGQNDFQYYHLIYDAFEGRAYGSFDSFSKAPRPEECSIKPRSHAEINCNSDDDFDRLALEYFGTTPD